MLRSMTTITRAGYFLLIDYKVIQTGQTKIIIFLILTRYGIYAGYRIAPSTSKTSTTGYHIATFDSKTSTTDYLNAFHHILEHTTIEVLTEKLAL